MAARGSKLATLVSAFAFAFSAVSLYETVIKQAQLKVYVTNTLLYTRDPYVGSEVIAVPITISNSGAREGAVVTLELDVKQLDSGRTELFSSTYTADAQYFGGHDDVTARIKRPKAPFAPLSIVGRSAYTGTILFYPKKDRETGQKPLIEGKSKIEMVLRVITLSPQGWLDRLLFSVPRPIKLAGEVDGFLPGALYVGETAKVRLSELPGP